MNPLTAILAIVGALALLLLIAVISIIGGMLIGGADDAWEPDSDEPWQAPKD